MKYLLSGGKICTVDCLENNNFVWWPVKGIKHCYEGMLNILKIFALAFAVLAFKFALRIVKDIN